MKCGRAPIVFIVRLPVDGQIEQGPRPDTGEVECWIARHQRGLQTQLEVHQLRPELRGPGLGVLLAEDGEGAQLVGDAAGVNPGQSHL